MTILHLISSRQVYGAEKVMLPLCKGLRAKGFKVVLGIMDHFQGRNELEAVALDEGLEVRRIVTKSQVDPKALKQIRQLVRELSPKIIHSHNYKSNFYAWLSKNTAKWVITAHGWCGTDLKTKGYDLLDKIFIRFADALVAVSLNIMEEFYKLYIRKDKCFYIPNGLSCLGGPRDKLDDIFTIGFVGRLETEKNIQVVIQTLLRFLQGRENAQALILGDGSQYDWIQEQIQRHGLQDKILLKGKVPPEDMPRYYQEIDCLFLPSLREGLPMVVLEALCFGIPIVGSAVALKDVGPKDFTRIISNPHQKDQAVEKALKSLEELEQLYQKPEAYLKLSRQAWQEAKKFDITTMTNKYIALYEKLGQN